jgi:hypothetical protein
MEHKDAGQDMTKDSKKGEEEGKGNSLFQGKTTLIIEDDMTVGIHEIEDSIENQ